MNGHGVPPLPLPTPRMGCERARTKASSSESRYRTARRPVGLTVGSWPADVMRLIVDVCKPRKRPASVAVNRRSLFPSFMVSPLCLPPNLVCGFVLQMSGVRLALLLIIITGHFYAVVSRYDGERRCMEGLEVQRGCVRNYFTNAVRFNPCMQVSQKKVYQIGTTGTVGESVMVAKKSIK